MAGSEIHRQIECGEGEVEEYPFHKSFLFSEKWIEWIGLVLFFSGQPFCVTLWTPARHAQIARVFPAGAWPCTAHRAIPRACGVGQQFGRVVTQLSHSSAVC